MSLRGRVIGLIGLVLLVSVAIYAVTAWSSARNELAVELGAARTGGLQTVRSAFEDLPHSDHPERDLRQLVATFEGNRHIKAAVFDSTARLRFTSQAASPDKAAPDWFAELLNPRLPQAAIQVPGGSGGVLILKPEPASDIASLWSADVGAIQLFAVAVGLGLTLIYLVIGRALAPLADLSEGLERIGGDGEHAPVAEQGPPELLKLQRGFNAMAERLADIDARNRTLEAQLLTIQDEERAEIARDLHDEIGPHLFAVALDAEMIGRSLAAGETRAIPEQIGSIKSAVSYMQREVRELIARLRPTRAAELGLEAALRDVIKFWRTRQPEIEYVGGFDGADTFVPDALRDVIYRVVQEAVANALRHAKTTSLAISVAQAADSIAVLISNRGGAKAIVDEVPGLGLTSMRERVHAAGGRLRIDKDMMGWTVHVLFERAGRIGS